MRRIVKPRGAASAALARPQHTGRVMAWALLVSLGLTGCGSSVPATRATPGRHPRPSARLVATVAPFVLPAAISRAVVVARSDGEVVIAGGLDAADQSVGGVFLLDPETGALKGLGALPEPTHDAGGALVGGRLLVFGGGTSHSVATVQAFPVSPGGGDGQVIGELPKPRSDLSTAVAGRTVYVVGGWDGTRPLKSVLATRDGRSFRVVARLADPVRYPAVVVVGHRLFVFGGATAEGRPVAAIQVVDPRDGTARVVGSLPTPLADAAAFVLDGEVFLAGGFAAPGEPSSALMRFDPATDRTTVVGELPTPIAAAGACVVGRIAYLVGGEDPALVASVQRLVLVAPDGRAHGRAKTD